MTERAATPARAQMTNQSTEPDRSQRSILEQSLPTEGDVETYYVDLARTLPQVRQVLVDESSPSTAIWTVIEAEPFDESQCEPVYQAELEALIAHPDAEVDLHLVNLSEYPGTPAEQLLPTNAQARYTP